MNEQEINNTLNVRELEEERVAKKLFYKNIYSIRKNVQFFFWATVIPIIIYFFKILIEMKNMQWVYLTATFRLNYMKMKKEEQKVLSNEEIYNLFGKRKINAKEFELVCQLNAKYHKHKYYTSSFWSTIFIC